MDYTPEYIKMCDCPEIQGQRMEYKQWQNGDFKAYRAGTPEALASVVQVHCKDCDMEYGGCGEVPDAVWLPREDQLCEMAPWPESPASQIHRIYDFMESRYPPDVSDEDWTLAEIVFGTWEQLWLAYVMHEYGKHWDGEAWV